MKEIKPFVRPSDCFVPIALLILSLTGYAESATQLYISMFSLSLLSLFSGRGLRLTFAFQPSVKSARGSVKCALLLQFCALAASLITLSSLELWDIRTVFPLLLSGSLLNIEHVFYEYLFAIGESHSATLCQVLTSLFLTTGIVLTGKEGIYYRPAWIVGTSAVSAAISLIISISIGGTEGRFNARVILSAPMAALQTSLYTLSFVILELLLPERNGASSAFFAGLALYELCRTPFRRTHRENGVFLKLLIITCLASALIASIALLLHTGLIPIKANADLNIYTYFDLPLCCGAFMLAALCAYSLFGSFDMGDD